MKKDIIKIVGIIAFFSLLGYALTYPYEVKLDNKDMVLIEDMHGKEFKTLKDIINYPELKGKSLYIVSLNTFSMLHSYEEKYQYIDVLNELHKKYKNTEFVYIYYPLFYRSSRDIDYVRKWKDLLNKNQLEGYQFLGSDELRKNMNNLVNFTNYFPYAIFVNTLGDIDVKIPQGFNYTPRAFYKKLDSLLNTQRNGTIISK